MTGSMLPVGLIAIVFAGLAIGLTGWGLVPIIVLAMAAFFAVPIAAVMNKANVGEKVGGQAEPHDAPNTRDASYKPIVDPDEHAVGH